MEKNLKDYAAYYLGCRCLNTWFPVGHAMYDNEWKLDGYREHSPKPYLLGNTEDETWTDSIKLVLRSLWHITDEEMKYIALELKAGTENVEMLKWHHIEPWTCFRLTPPIIHYLLKQGFDLFSLCESGLAIDAVTLTK